MPETKRSGNKNAIIAGGVVVVVLVAALVFMMMRNPDSPAPVPVPPPEKPEQAEPVRVPVNDQAVIDFESEDETGRDLMAERKAEYGMNEGIDINVTVAPCELDLEQPRPP